ncbi:hypothetical protein P170DRAFT_437956 [Aspergillus steynii IBT 23096]|uniref:Uncharacterized protein n=1 Tax=Aspergillus steynii IBT 23096 TaxID=1392250 RepID=A0A2I2G607_9EURO|nr:uncharacterized protein P170DRAFT_437956 [Aspergillus steynii IBT 23096]PLB48283.1 hypothetical protein P170DRAFT_437956 [Aspergillus steynii IBT 23096]
MWPNYVLVRSAERLCARPSTNNSHPASQPAENSTSSGLVTPDTSARYEENAGDEESIFDFESEPGMEGFDLDADWIPGEFGIAEMNTSSDWYQASPVTIEIPNGGRKRVAEDPIITELDEMSNAFESQVEANVVIESEIVITEGETSFL